MRALLRLGTAVGYRPVREVAQALALSLCAATRVRDLLPRIPQPRPEPFPDPRVGPVAPSPRPFPLPDPPPFRLDRHTLDAAGGVLDPEVARLLDRASDQGGLESMADQAEALLDVSLFPTTHGGTLAGRTAGC